MLVYQRVLDVFDGFCALPEHPSEEHHAGPGGTLQPKGRRKRWHHVGAIRVCNRGKFLCGVYPTKMIKMGIEEPCTENQHTTRPTTYKTGANHR